MKYNFEISESNNFVSPVNTVKCYIKERGFPWDDTLVCLPGCNQIPNSKEFDVEVQNAYGELIVPKDFKARNFEPGLSLVEFAAPSDSTPSGIKIIDGMAALKYLSSL